MFFRAEINDYFDMLLYKFKMKNLGMLALLGLLAFEARAAEVSKYRYSSNFREMNIAALNLAKGAISSTFHFSPFGQDGKFVLGPSISIQPLYLFVRENPILSFSVGVDSHYYFNGNCFSSSWFVNPYTYLSVFTGYRIEEPTLSYGFNFGYRWYFKTGLTMTLGAGLRSEWNHQSVYSYSAQGRTFMGSSNQFYWALPSMKFTVGFPI